MIAVCNIDYTISNLYKTKRNEMKQKNHAMDNAVDYLHLPELKQMKCNNHHRQFKFYMRNMLNA